MTEVFNMNKEEIIKLAREAHLEALSQGKGMHVWHGDAFIGDVQDFCVRFAAFVAAAEREACAEVCDGMDHNGVMIAADCAAAIRARGNT